MRLLAEGRWVWRALSFLPLLILMGIMFVLWVTGLIFPSRRRYVLRVTGQCREMFVAMVDANRP